MQLQIQETILLLQKGKKYAYKLVNYLVRWIYTKSVDHLEIIWVQPAFNEFSVITRMLLSIL